MQARVHFHSECSRRDAVAAAFAVHRQQLEELLPGAEVQHIGSTAVPGSLTKGDLDINMSVNGAAAVDLSTANFSLYANASGFAGSTVNSTEVTTIASVVMV